MTELIPVMMFTVKLALMRQLNMIEFEKQTAEWKDEFFRLLAMQRWLDDKADLDYTAHYLGVSVLDLRTQLCSWTPLFTFYTP